MSPLWKRCKVKQLLTNPKRPSPKQDSENQCFAQNSKFCPCRQIPQTKLISNAIKGISLFISSSRQIGASMTVEAAVVLPLFLFFFLNLGCAIEILRLHSNLEFALFDIGNRMTICGGVLIEERQEEMMATNNFWEELKDVALSYTYVKNEIKNYVGEKYLEESPVDGGVDGLQFLESEIFDGEDCLEIIVTYKVAPLSSIAGFGSFRMANKYYGHLWTGYQIPGTEDERQDRVYIAENGVVYHESENCSHLLLSVRRVSLQEAYVSRNIEGRRYTPCIRCKSAVVQGTVYITDEGDNIHYREDCAGLKRTVLVISKEEASKYRPCSRCGQK